MSTVEKWGWMSVVCALSAVLGLGALLIVTVGGLDSEQNQAIASWVQAVGSIAAIVFASVHASRQAAEAECLVDRQRLQARRDRLASIQAIAKVARDHVEMVAYGLAAAPDGARFNGLVEFFDARLLQESRGALEQIPLHELESVQMVEAMIKLRLALRSAEHGLNVACTDEPGQRDPDDFTNAARTMRADSRSAMASIEAVVTAAATDAAT